jgi:hypothetical protein
VVTADSRTATAPDPALCPAYPERIEPSAVIGRVAVGHPENGRDDMRDRENDINGDFLALV